MGSNRNSGTFGSNGRGFITADQAASGNATDLVVHDEISYIESQILVQSNSGFLSVVIDNSLMTSSNFNTPVTITNVNSTAITTGNTLAFSSTTGIVSGMTIADFTNPAAIPTGTTVTSVTATTVVMNNNVVLPGVMNNDTIYFSNVSLATTVVGVAYGNTLTFASVTGVTVGMYVIDTTTTGAIPVGTTVASITGNVVTLSNQYIGNVPLGDVISFSLALPIVSANVGSSEMVYVTDQNNIISFSTETFTGVPLSTISVTGTQLIAGTPVMLTSSTTLPTPLQTNTVYYLIPTTTANIYALASSKQNALARCPVSISITSVPAGTNYMTVMLQSELYFRAWQNYYDTMEYRMYANQMATVIDYFTGLGYCIKRLQATDNTGALIDVFNWQIRW